MVEYINYSELPKLAEQIKTAEHCSVSFKRRMDNKLSRISGKFVADKGKETFLMHSKKGYRSLPLENIVAVKISGRIIRVKYE